jgi:hypothetical protein
MPRGLHRRGLEDLPASHLPPVRLRREVNPMRYDDTVTREPMRPRRKPRKMRAAA